MYNIAGNEEISIYPNPANQEVYSRLTDNEFAYSVFNILGEKLMEGYSNGTHSINVSNLSAGMYVFEIQQDHKIIRQKQLIIH